VGGGQKQKCRPIAAEITGQGREQLCKGSNEYFLFLENKNLRCRLDRESVDGFINFRPTVSPLAEEFEKAKVKEFKILYVDI